MQRWSSSANPLIIELVTGVHDALMSAAAVCRDALALVDGEHEFSFGELYERSCGFAAAYESRGVSPGDRVVLLQRKSVDSVAALYGCWIAGAIAVPTHVALRERQLRHIVSHCGAKLVVASGREHAMVEDVASSGDFPPFLDPQTVGHASDSDGRPQDGASGAAILYTSGSTGLPKGILLSHQNLIAGARIVSSYLTITPEDRLLSVLPFHFDYGLNQLLTTVQQRATLVLCRSTFAGSVVRALSTHRITGLAGVPPLWVQLMAPGSPLRTEGANACPDLRYITNSGGAFPVPLLRQYREALPDVDVYLMYGLSEAFRSSYLPPEELDEKPTAMGRAVPETELLVLDEDSQRCPDGVVGELVHRGPTVAMGYWNDPAATASTFRSDPDDMSAPPVVYSGDLVRREPDGTLFYVGRRDQRMKCFGHRVNPEEVEHALASMVREVVVGGVSDEVAGTRVVAHIVLREGVDEDGVWKFCRAELPPYMQPIRIEVHSSLPRTGSGKVARKAVLAGAASVSSPPISSPKRQP